MTDVLMPALSDSMQEGTILTWLVAEGAAVQAGQQLAEIETDKATVTFEAPGDGVLSIVTAAGETVAVGAVIARVREGAAAPDEVTAPSTSPDANGRHEDVAATPMARRIAAAHGVALDELTGTGPRGRVVKSDVIQAAGLEPEPEPASPRRAPGTGDELVQPTRLRALVARRMTEAKATIPHFQVQTEVEMTSALAFREQLKRVAAAREQAVPSLNDLVVKACAIALRRHPRANGSYVDGGFRFHARINVGIAVAADDGLVVPVIHDADTRTLGEIASAVGMLATAVRDGSVTPPQLAGATFTVSNLGMYGMTAIAPVVNPPQAAILGVGAIRETLARAPDGAIVDHRPLTLTLSGDHRILDGADAARFLGDVRTLLEDPAGLAL